MVGRFGPIDWNDIDVRGEIERHGSIRKAAKALGVGYGTLQARARALEEEPGEAGGGPLTKEGRAAMRKDAELRFLRTEVRKLSEAVLDQRTALEDVAERLERPLEPPAFESSTRSLGKKKRDVLLHLSDLHYGEYVREDDVAGAHAFNAEVFVRRAERYVDAVCNSMADYAEGHTLENLIIAIGGDVVTGDNVFANQPWQLDRHPIEQCTQVTDIIEGMLHEIMRTARVLGMRETRVFCVPGNHGRTQGRRSGGQPATYSWDHLVYLLLEKDLKDYPIDSFVIEPGGTLYFGSQDHVFQLAHGDEVRGALSIPFYGVGRYDLRSIRSHSIVPDYLLLGHHHQEARIPLGYGTAMHSGSWMGVNNLSRHVGQSPATQNMWLVSSEYGAAQHVLIHLTTRDERRSTPEVHASGS